MCPEDVNGPCGHAVTGCVAKAMAQILKYWNYPHYGRGTNTYNHNVYGLLTADFENTEYLWNLMLNELTEDNLAVATLMYHCGVSVNMNYGTYESGAYPSPNAFINYFRYSPNARHVYQNQYEFQEWINLLKNQIDNLQPILYLGFSNIVPSGYAWVIDGYDIDNYFHFNWGWDSEGAYYLLYDQPYPNNQAAIIDIFPIPQCDIRLIDITSPIFNITFAEPQNVTIRLSNYGSTPISNIPISLKINDEIVFEEIIAETLLPGDTLTYQFSQEYDFSIIHGGSFDIVIYSDVLCDSYRFNDTLKKTIINVECADIPYSLSAGGDDLGWFYEDANNDGYTWILTGEGSLYQYFAWYHYSPHNYGDDWLFSRCLNLESGKVYKLKFDYRGIGLYW